VGLGGFEGKYTPRRKNIQAASAGVEGVQIWSLQLLSNGIPQRCGLCHEIVKQDNAKARDQVAKCREMSTNVAPCIRMSRQIRFFSALYFLTSQTVLQCPHVVAGSFCWQLRDCWPPSLWFNFSSDRCHCISGPEHSRPDSDVSQAREQRRTNIHIGNTKHRRNSRPWEAYRRSGQQYSGSSRGLQSPYSIPLFRAS